MVLASLSRKGLNIKLPTTNMIRYTAEILYPDFRYTVIWVDIQWYESCTRNICASHSFCVCVEYNLQPTGPTQPLSTHFVMFTKALICLLSPRFKTFCINPTGDKTKEANARGNMGAVERKHIESDLQSTLLIY